MSETTIHVRLRCNGPGAALLRVRADPTDDRQIVVSDALDTADGSWESIATPVGRLDRVVFAEGARTLSYRARVMVTRGGRTPAAPPDLDRASLGLTHWTEPSRYCPSDQLAPTASAIVGALPRAELIARIRDWVAGEIAYRPGATGPLVDATDTLLAREGVCRDFAHLTVSLLRASGVPARVVAVYSPMVDPPDFHAIAEAHDGVDWIMLDGTGMSVPSNAVRIATGLDAAQTAWATATGDLTIESADVSVSGEGGAPARGGE